MFLFLIFPNTKSAELNIVKVFNAKACNSERESCFAPLVKIGSGAHILHVVWA